MSEIPQRRVSRTARLASLPLGVAGRATLGLGKRMTGKSAEDVAAEMQARTAEQLFAVLGELKGGARACRSSRPPCRRTTRRPTARR